jgi:hypothetical protein
MYEQQKRNIERAVRLLDEHIAGVCKTLFEYLSQTI